MICRARAMPPTDFLQAARLTAGIKTNGTVQTRGYLPLFQHQRGETEPQPHPNPTYATTDSPQTQPDGSRQASTVRRLFCLIPHFIFRGLRALWQPSAHPLWSCYWAQGAVPTSVHPSVSFCPSMPRAGEQQEFPGSSISP